MTTEQQRRYNAIAGKASVPAPPFPKLPPECLKTFPPEVKSAWEKLWRLIEDWARTQPGS